MLNSREVSRRKFIKSSLLGAVGLSFIPQLLSANSFSKLSSQGTIRVGFIGLGQQAMSILNGFLPMKDIEVVAGCDVYAIKKERFTRRVNRFYQNAEKNVKVEVYQNYKDVLARKDVDLVVIATPDHAHALIAVAACEAKKDIYLEKPLTFTVTEGRALVNAVRKNKVILAVGSQQRSDGGFQHAVDLVQKGRLGKISKIYASVGPAPTPYDLPKETIPTGLDWELWLGPLDERIHYNEKVNPSITLDPEVNEKGWAEWRYFKETGGGYTTDWGAHMFDIAQWAIGMDRKGPSQIIPPGHNGKKYLTYIYENGIEMSEQPYDDEASKGVKFFGEKGWIEVGRGYFEASSKDLYPKEAGKSALGYETLGDHYGDFIRAVQTRKDPIVSVEIGHSTCACCTIGNIAIDLKRPLTWDYKTEKFINDKEANSHRLMGYKYKKGYSL